jgi:3-oxoacyl-[acyl-carrier protein] reductase
MLKLKKMLASVIAAPEDITKIILFLASDDSKWISGQIIAANGAMA